MSAPGGFHDAADDFPVDAADYIIIGSGAGGGAAARVLAAAGHSVLVLEEGPMPRTERLSPVMRESMAYLFRKHGKMAALGRATMPILQGRCVGGTTFVNSAIIWRIPAKVLTRWHDDFGLGEGFSTDALEAAYTTIEAEMHVRPVGEEIARRANTLMRDASEKLGLEGRFLHRNERGCQGSSRCLYGCPNEAKQSTTINYLRRAVDDGASVVAHARVERVVLEGDRAVGVTGRAGGDGPRSGTVFRARARRAVIVAASAIGSPNLLRRSGVRSAALGDHFMAHPGTSVMAVYPDRVNMWDGASQGYEALGLRDKLGVKLEAINIPPEVIAGRLPGAGARYTRWFEKLDHICAWSAAVRADAEGTVRPSWLFGDMIRYSLLPGDVDRLRQGLKHLAGMHFAAGALEVLPGIFGLPEVLSSPDELRRFDDASVDSRHYGLVATHLFGGCRAARDPRAGVVDGQLKVHGVDGLYVMDASIFPTNTGVNPQHSIMALATVAARRLAAA